MLSRCFSRIPPSWCASMLMDEALSNLDRTKEISVSTFRADDEKGLAPRALYEKYGFIADALVEEMNYPNQRYVLHPIGAERKDRQLAINTMVREISGILSDREPSIYMYGSSVLNDFRLGWSDIDILVLTSKQMTEEQAKSLVGLRQAMLADEQCSLIRKGHTQRTKVSRFPRTVCRR